MQYSTAIKNRNRNENLNYAKPKITKNPGEFNSTELNTHLLKNRLTPVTLTFDPEMLSDINMNPMMEESNIACIRSPRSVEYQITEYNEIVRFLIEVEKADGEYISGMDDVYFSKLKSKINSDGTPRFCRFEVSRIQKIFEDLKRIIYVESQKKYDAEVQERLLKFEPHAKFIACEDGFLDDLTINQILMQDILLDNSKQEKDELDDEDSVTEDSSEKSATNDEYDAQLYPPRNLHADYFKNYNRPIFCPLPYTETE